MIGPTETARSATPPVAIAVVSWNTRELLDRCLASIKPEVDSGRAEVWVIDNASADGSPELVRERHPWAELIALDENIGFGGAVNLVAERTESEWIAPANADIELTPGALARLLSTGSSYAEAGVVAPRLVYPSGQSQHSVYRFPTISFTLAFNLGLGSISKGIADSMCLEGSWNPSRPRWVDWALGAFLIVRREAWDRIGGFDSEQWMYAEDLDLGWRLAKAGWRTRFDPGAAVVHVSDASTSQAWGAARIDRQWESTYAWMFRRRGRVATRSTAAINFAGALGRAAVLAIPARLAPARYGARYRAMRGWARRHAIGMRRARSLRSHR